MGLWGIQKVLLHYPLNYVATDREQILPFRCSDEKVKVKGILLTDDTGCLKKTEFSGYAGRDGCDGCLLLKKMA